MKIYLSKLIISNRAPFNKIELDFNENEIAVLTAVNGKGKTTILSHIVDAFYEIIRPHYDREFEGKENKYYRVSSNLFSINQSIPSIVYLRFDLGGEKIDYIDIRGKCTEAQYNDIVQLDGKIPFTSIESELSNNTNTKLSSQNLDKNKVQTIFSKNVLTYFPSYRYEIPGYLNDPYKIKLNFRVDSPFAGYLNNPIEVVTGLPQLANWMLDIILDLQYTATNVRQVLHNLNNIMTLTLVSKQLGILRIVVGPRNFGGTRIQIVTRDGDQVYPSIFNLSSGENAAFCLFAEILKQADTNTNNILLDQITGIVLIDEVDKHLHIKLQKEILPVLFTLFPNVQFILSSHSPFLSMGLAETTLDRSKIIDLDNNGIYKDPSINQLYIEVYNMIINENANFKKMYEDVQNQIQPAKSLQIVTEGQNVEHIEKAIQILDSTLVQKIHLIKGAEDKSGDQQLKNAFDIMSKGNHIGKFLFVWDCDSQARVNSLTETNNFYKFVLIKDESNPIAKKGIENLYPASLFTDEVYDLRQVEIEYGGKKDEKVFNKAKFLSKVKNQSDQATFEKFTPLLDKIRAVIT